MKYKSLLLAAAPVVLLAACASAPQPAAPTQSSCLPSGKAVPEWVCGTPAPGLAISAVGVANPTRAGMSHQISIAEADGRAKLVEQFKTQASKMVKNYLGTTGTGDSETVDSVSESVLRTVSDGTVVGSRRFGMVSDDDGTLYVLMGMEDESMRQAATQAVASSMNKDSALWQEFKADQSFDEMAEAIASQPVE